MPPLHLTAYVGARGARINCGLAPEGSVLTGSHRGYTKKSAFVHRRDISHRLDAFKSVAGFTKFGA
jgi:hypothetical protein